LARSCRLHRHGVLIGPDDVDPLDGHLMLTPLKVAFGLALLETRKDISEDDWKIGGDLLQVSKQVRTELPNVIAERRRRDNTATAHDQADRETIIAARLSESHRSVSRRRSHESSNAWTQRHAGNCGVACDVSISGDFDPVFDMFIDKRFLVCCEGGEARADRYSLRSNGWVGVTSHAFHTSQNNA
jgi:hypothetical protein